MIFPVLRPLRVRIASILSLLLLVCLDLRAQAPATAPPICTPEFTHQRADNYAPLAAAPEKARARANPLAGNPNAIRAGRKLFAQHCAQCHGSDADGGNKAPSLRDKEVQQATAGSLFWLLTNGVVRHGMPVWSKLPEPQRWQIVSYIQTLQTAVPANIERDGTHRQ